MMKHTERLRLANVVSEEAGLDSEVKYECLH